MSSAGSERARGTEGGVKVGWSLSVKAQQVAGVMSTTFRKRFRLLPLRRLKVVLLARGDRLAGGRMRGTGLCCQWSGEGLLFFVVDIEEHVQDETVKCCLLFVLQI